MDKNAIIVIQKGFKSSKKSIGVGRGGVEPGYGRKCYVFEWVFCVFLFFFWTPRRHARQTDGANRHGDGCFLKGEKEKQGKKERVTTYRAKAPHHYSIFQNQGKKQQQQ